MRDYGVTVVGHVSEINQDYYDRLYGPKSPILHLLRARVSFDQQSKSRPNHAMVDPFLEHLARENGSVKVLDYGSGWGVFLLDMPEVAAETYCFDISTNAIKSLVSAMDFLGRSVGEIGFDEKRNILPADFDLIVCSHVLEHVESDQVLVRQLVQALRPGGCLLANVPINEVCTDPKHARRYTPEVLEGLMISSGLSVVARWEGDRWSGYVLAQEEVHKSRPMMRLALRALRGLLALLPYPLVRLAENVLLCDYQPQQLIMLGVKEYGQGAGCRSNSSSLWGASNHDQEAA